jgi:hypothetical protein
MKTYTYNTDKSPPLNLTHAASAHWSRQTHAWRCCPPPPHTYTHTQSIYCTSAQQLRNHDVNFVITQNSRQVHLHPLHSKRSEHSSALSFTPWAKHNRAKSCRYRGHSRLFGGCRSPKPVTTPLRGRAGDASSRTQPAANTDRQTDRHSKHVTAAWNKGSTLPANDTFIYRRNVASCRVPHTPLFGTNLRCSNRLRHRQALTLRHNCCAQTPTKEDLTCPRTPAPASNTWSSVNTIKPHGY